MEIVKARIDDFEAINEHYINIIDHTPDIEKYARWEKGLHPTVEGIKGYIESSAMYLCMDDDNITVTMAVTMEQGADYHDISWGMAAKDDEVAVIHILGVSPEYQGKGIGGQMIDEAIRLAKVHHKKAVRLDALASNLPAQHLYEAKGFIYKGKLNWYAKNTGWTDFYFYEYVL